ncbi:MAG: glycosyltransferase family 2 protein [Planctomycetota bacterium]
MVIKVSIGVLAHNEEVNIPATLRSLLAQSIVARDDASYDVEIIVVPNGCRDRTAAVAAELLGAAALPRGRRFQVRELTQPGKSNAWNHYVHEFARADCDYFVLMDADIQFLQPDTLQQLIDALERDPIAYVSCDCPVKDVELKDSRTLMEALSLRISGDSSAVRPAEICGQLYCARASMLRRISLPKGITIEDGFLRALLVTELFTQQENLRRVTRVMTASHVFESYVRVSILLKHEANVILGTLVNSFVYDWLWRESRPDRDAGALLHARNRENPEWLKDHVAEHVRKRGWWVVPWPLVFRRWIRLRQKGVVKGVLHAPITMVAFLADFAACVRVNRLLHSRAAVGSWVSKPTPGAAPPSPPG